MLNKFKGNFNIQGSWVKQEKGKDIDFEDCIVTEYCCFLLKDGRCFYGSIFVDSDDFSLTWGTTFITYDGYEIIDYCDKDSPYYILGNTIEEVEKLELLDSWYILTIEKPKLQLEKNL